MSSHPNAGAYPTQEQLIHTPALVADYYTLHPDTTQPECSISFGTSGHRGSASKGSFNEEHILAMTQAVCDIRAEEGINGPLFLGMDTHALSECAQRSALEVLAANGITVFYQRDNGYTPTPVISHSILCWNQSLPASSTRGQADGIVITPSHNPPADGGFKYNPPHGGPAETSLTRRIQQRANELLRQTPSAIKRVSLRSAYARSHIKEHDFITPYVADLAAILDMEAIRDAGIRIGADPLGGASLAYWEPIADNYHLNLTLLNRDIDPTFRFVPLDRDGVIRMDCSSPWAMRSLLERKQDFDLVIATDPDADRHGVVTADGLMNPNSYLATAIWHLYQTRPQWNVSSAIGKTLVTSAIVDRVAEYLGRSVYEVPVGFKWFVPTLLEGSCAFGGEESAGASFLRKNGTPWSTDKDGILLTLLAAEIMAHHGKSPAHVYKDITSMLGNPVYERLQAPATLEQRAAFASLDVSTLPIKELAGSPVTAILTYAPGNNAPIGGLKVVSREGWFAARPSGTEDIYKIYTESFAGTDHLHKIQTEAMEIVRNLMKRQLLHKTN